MIQPQPIAQRPERDHLGQKRHVSRPRFPLHLHPDLPQGLRRNGRPEPPLLEPRQSGVPSDRTDFMPLAIDSAGQISPC